MKLKGIIDCDYTNYKKPVLTLEFPYCSFKCDTLNGCRICQNSGLVYEPDIDVSFEYIWTLYSMNPLTKGFCCQGLEPLDSGDDFHDFIKFIREDKKCDDDIVIYTGYTKEQIAGDVAALRKYKNIIIKYGPFIMNEEPHYDEVLGVKLASNNQYAEYLI